ncbi:lipid transfer-like protein VAS [Prunus yedoensis var. nudiflora]|uniref:Lipid transfer-like protein VAS n=1 Tax=Prunus yedoensis var. nudiflora TaxID=2094558 RepID=A0A314ZBM6_PRUYE|nr:lipid transfer-like protein VAS [Prunus yedoensis var. nudiflora]
MASISKRFLSFLPKLSGLSDQEGTGGGSGTREGPCSMLLATQADGFPRYQCLCSLFNNPGMLSNLNITQDDALKLPKACGANADISICEKDASSSTPPAATPASNNSSSSSSSKSAAYAPSHFGGSGFAAFFMALIITFTAF